MDEQVEKRSTKRFFRHAAVEIRGHTRSNLCAKGKLIDCSEGGVGFFSREEMKRGDVVLLRVCAASSRETSRWSSEAGPFNMITAKVRWCLESQSRDGEDGFRVGSQRMLPFY
jgi:hypothetical protein